MKPYAKYCLAIVLLFISFSCSDKPQKGSVDFGGYHLVVISHTNDGRLLDYMAFNDLSNISMIKVNPENGHKDINVTLFGSKRHEALQQDVAVTSKDMTGYKGCVEISIQGGVAVGSFGNGFQMPSPITDATIEDVANALAAGRLNSETEATFEVTIETEEVDASDS